MCQGTFTLQFSDNFFNYRKIWFHGKGIDNCFIIFYIFLPFLSDVNLHFFYHFSETKIDQVPKRLQRSNFQVKTLFLKRMRDKLRKDDISIKQKLHTQEQEVRSSQQLKKTHNREKNNVEVKKVNQPRFHLTLLFLVFETLLYLLLCFINCEHAAAIFFLNVSSLLPILFTSRCSPLLY